jgi:hypothetical protein
LKVVQEESALYSKGDMLQLLGWDSLGCTYMYVKSVTAPIPWQSFSCSNWCWLL